MLTVPIALASGPDDNHQDQTQIVDQNGNPLALHLIGFAEKLEELCRLTKQSEVSEVANYFYKPRKLLQGDVYEITSIECRQHPRRQIGNPGHTETRAAGLGGLI